MPKDSRQENIRMAFARRFKEALSELGVSPNEQTELGKMFGVSGQAVKKWADGASLPSSSRLPIIAEILGVRRAWLQDGEGSMYPEGLVAEDNPNYQADAVTLKPAEMQLIQNFKKLTSRQQSVVTNLINSFIEN